MLKLITDEGTFEYTDIYECIGEWLSDRIDMNVPSNEAIIQFAIQYNTTNTIGLDFGTYIENQIKMNWSENYVY